MSCEDELAVLEGAWDSDRSEFIVVYSRRGAGKTALLRTFCAKRPHTFWVASPSSWLSEIPAKRSNRVRGVFFICFACNVLASCSLYMVRYVGPAYCTGPVHVGRGAFLNSEAWLEILGSDSRAGPDVGLRPERVGVGARGTVYQILAAGLADALDSRSMLVYYITGVVPHRQQSNPSQHS